MGINTLVAKAFRMNPNDAKSIEHCVADVMHKIVGSSFSLTARARDAERKRQMREANQRRFYVKRKEFLTNLAKLDRATTQQLADLIGANRAYAYRIATHLRTAGKIRLVDRGETKPYWEIKGKKTNGKFENKS